ncbi:GrpB family protein [Nostoc sp.]
MSKQPIVEIVDYNPQWPRFFSELSTIIIDKLGNLALAIEHVGST